ncbi:MAG: phosphate ABC transporter substrate-binding/OmpA family protein [Verrucomicrobiota bacterium]
MKKLFVALCILTLVAMVAWKLTEGTRESRSREQLLLQSSDARKFDRTLTILGDGWLGYMIFRSRSFQDELAKHNLGIQYQHENDFKKRFQALRNGQADLALATIDSYLLNGKSSNYPGVLTFLIDESFGGDALIGGPGIQSLDDLRKENLKGAFVGYSPSEFLIKSQVSLFQINQLQPRLNQFRVDDDKTAFKKLQSGQADFAVLWEPHVSNALQQIKGTSRIIDTAKAKNLIIDVAIASRQLAAKEPDTLAKLTQAYFTALNQLLSDRDLLLQLAIADSGENQEQAARMLAGIRFTNYQTNLTDWFPIDNPSTARLAPSIQSIGNILTDLGDLTTLPDTPTILNSQTLATLRQNPATHQTLSEGPAQVTPATFFTPLPADQWQTLAAKATGTLLEQPVTFPPGSANIPDEFQEQLKAATQKLIHYPYHRLLIQAHVSPGTDPQTDLTLSQQRADTIRDFLINNNQLPPNRIHALGLGATQTPERKTGESPRAWKRRCRRALILLATD